MSVSDEEIQQDSELLPEAVGVIELTDQMLGDVAGGLPPITCRYVSCNIIG